MNVPPSLPPVGPSRENVPNRNGAGYWNEKAQRRTLAFLIDYPDLVGQSYGVTLRDAVDAACRELDINLYIVIGHGLEDPEPTSRVHNRAYEWLHPSSIDGVVLLSTSLAAHAGTSAVSRLCSRYQMSLCSIGLVVPQVPSVVVDNYLGMRAVVEHLVRDHGKRELVFVGGPPANEEGNERLSAYRDVLREAQLPVDPRRELCGRFRRSEAQAAVERLLDEGVHFDSVISANDAMAMGSLAALESRGLRVPYDVAITGFDDVHEVSLVNPPITTARQPLQDMARLAVDTVLDQIEGRSVPLVRQLPTDLVVRTSCGCGGIEPTSRHRTSGDPSQEESAAFFALHRERIESLIHRTFGSDKQAAERACQLSIALEDDLTRAPGTFIRSLDQALTYVDGDGRSYQQLQELITQLRNELRPITSPALEDTWHSARCSIMLGGTRSQVEQRLDTAALYNRATQTAEYFARLHGQATTHGTPPQTFPGAIVDNAFVSRFVSEEMNTLAPWLCVFDGQWYEPSISTFPARDLIPGRNFPDGRRHTSLVLPLTSEQLVLGVAILEFAPKTKGHEILRDQLAFFLNSQRLHEQVLSTTTLHERSVQERVATARRMQSLSVLAGGVAHDLNNVLGPLVALPDVIRTTLQAAIDGDRAAAAELRDDIECIKTASLRASHTIKDLLTLGRQGRTEKGLVDLNAVVADAVREGSPRLAQGASRRVQVQHVPSSEPLWVNGSEAHLGRAISNLVRNAIEAIQTSGSVSIRAYAIDVVETLVRFEAIDPGSYAVVCVSDTGSGIPKTDLNQVFEPFFSKKKLGDESGTGLGLAIVHGVIKEHGGFVDVESHVGQGTTFSLYFPRVAARTVAPRRRSSPLPLRHARILVVDDEQVQLRTSRRVLASLGYSVETCTSGRSARELFQAAVSLRKQPSSMDGTATPFDLVILDMLLHEDRDGLEVLEDIRNIVPEQRVIIASGHAPTERIERALAAGLVWLAKPFTANELERVVRKALALPTNLTPKLDRL